jgi:hypothetical protein
MELHFPEPCTPTAWGLFEALSLMIIFAARCPFPLGPNRTPILHFPPLGRVAPVQVVAAVSIVNSELSLLATLLMTAGAGVLARVCHRHDLGARTRADLMRPQSRGSLAG